MIKRDKVGLLQICDGYHSEGGWKARGVVTLSRSEGTQKLKEVLLCFQLGSSPAFHVTDFSVAGFIFGQGRIVAIVDGF